MCDGSEQSLVLLRTSIHCWDGITEYALASRRNNRRISESGIRIGATVSQTLVLENLRVPGNGKGRATVSSQLSGASKQSVLRIVLPCFPGVCFCFVFFFRIPFFLPSSCARSAPRSSARRDEIVWGQAGDEPGQSPLATEQRSEGLYVYRYMHTSVHRDNTSARLEQYCLASWINAKGVP